MYAAPPILEAEEFIRVPENLRNDRRETPWTKARGEGTKHSFLEGPSFDREGNFYCVDIANGRIFKISPKLEWEVFAQYDGQPNGLKIHADGRIFVADKRHGIFSFDPRTRERSTVVDRHRGEHLRGPNDLVFGSNGDLYFTDQGQSHLNNPNGRVFRLTAAGDLQVLMQDLPGPNGLVLDKTEKNLHVAATRSNQIVSIPLVDDPQSVSKTRTFIQMSGGANGPDGMALDEDGNIVVVHAGFGTVWIFSPHGEPIYRIKSCAGMRTTNVAYGGKDMRTLYITEGDEGVVMQIRLPTPGKTMYSHM